MLLRYGQQPSRYAFLTVWTLSTALLGWLIVQGQRRFDQPAAVVCLLAGLTYTAAMLWWLPGPPVPEHAAAKRTRRGLLTLTALGAAGVLFALHAVAGRALLFGFPLAAVVALAVLRPRPSKPELAYASALAAVAASAGLGSGWISHVSPEVWALQQLALVLTGLLAGWAILRHVGLDQAGVGRSLFVSEGAWRALSGFGWGVLLAVPWALANVALGGANGDVWVKSWWQPLIAIQPGIAEEAWARVLLVSLLFLALRPFGRARVALAVAVAVAGYWFAYLHTSGGVGGLISALLIGTIFSLPLSYLWLRRGLEPAMGFHYCADFVRFSAAYLLNAGLWPW